MWYMLSYTNLGGDYANHKDFQDGLGDEQLEYQLIPAPGALTQPV